MQTEYDERRTNPSLYYGEKTTEYDKLDQDKLAYNILDLLETRELFLDAKKRLRKQKLKKALKYIALVIFSALVGLGLMLLTLWDYSGGTLPW